MEPANSAGGHWQVNSYTRLSLDPVLRLPVGNAPRDHSVGKWLLPGSSPGSRPTWRASRVNKQMSRRAARFASPPESADAPPQLEPVNGSQLIATGQPEKGRGRRFSLMRPPTGNRQRFPMPSTIGRRERPPMTPRRIGHGAVHRARGRGASPDADSPLSPSSRPSAQPPEVCEQAFGGHRGA